MLTCRPTPPVALLARPDDSASIPYSFASLRTLCISDSVGEDLPKSRVALPALFAASATESSAFFDFAASFTVSVPNFLTAPVIFDITGLTKSCALNMVNIENLLDMVI
jgi:hypothetical protein